MLTKHARHAELTPWDCPGSGVSRILPRAEPMGHYSDINHVFPRLGWKLRLGNSPPPRSFSGIVQRLFRQGMQCRHSLDHKSPYILPGTSTLKQQTYFWVRLNVFHLSGL